VAGQALNPHQQYLKTRIETATQPQLLLMLFDAAVKKLHLAKKAIDQKEIEKAHTELTKVQRIFTELMVALDMEKGGDLAGNLIRVYDFIYHHLVKANIRQDKALIDEVLPIVESLRDGWLKAVTKYEEENGLSAAPAQGETGTAKRFDVKADTLSRPNFSQQQRRPGMQKPYDDQPIMPGHPGQMAQPAASARPVPPKPNADQPERPRLNLRG
jgi:flagellar secretion chaperone FliS